MFRGTMAVIIFLAAAATGTAQMFVYVCGGGDKGHGIYVSTLDMRAGTLSEPALAAEVNQTVFLAVNRDRTRAYCAARTQVDDGKLIGSVEAFDINRETGKLTLINRQPTRGAAWYVSLDRSEKTLLVANYDEGSVASFPLEKNGAIGELASFAQHQGKSVTARQQGPHAHSFLADPTSRFAIAADLGADKLVVYELDAATAKLTPQSEVKTAPGSGPRHFIFDDLGRRAYVLNELNGTICVSSFQPKNGEFARLQTTSTLPDGFDGVNTSAEICLHPSGKFIYASNRGPDTIAIFCVAAETGKLSLVGFESTRGRLPRNFCIDPTGQYLLAAAERDDRVSVFRIDAETGKLAFTGSQVSVPSPLCVRCVQVK